MYLIYLSTSVGPFINRIGNIEIIEIIELSINQKKSRIRELSHQC